MPYRNFRTADSGLGNLFLLALLITLGLIGLTRPSSNIAAIDYQLAGPTSRIDATSTPAPANAAPERDRSKSQPEREESTSRILHEHDETSVPRTVQGLHHGRDFESPSTLADPVPGRATPVGDM
jgi:hypothetical protein